MSQVDMGVICCQQNQEDEFTYTDNNIQEKIMETVKERELTYSEYLTLIETEERVIEDIDNQIERAEEELEDVNISIDLKEAERLSEIKSIYDTLVATREAKEVKLEAVEDELEERRNYLKSLKEDEVIDNEYKEIQDQNEVRHNPLEFLDNWEAPENKEGKYPIENSDEYKQKVADATYFIDYNVA